MKRNTRVSNPKISHKKSDDLASIGRLSNAVTSRAKEFHNTALRIPLMPQI